MATWLGKQILFSVGAGFFSDDEMTAEEAKVAKNLGISVEKYAKAKKKIRGY